MNSTYFAKIPLLAGMAATLLAFDLYGALGRPDVASASNQRLQTSSVARPAGDTGEKRKIASVDQLLTGLEQRLRQDPDDGKSWLLLAKSYDHLGRTRDSVAAYARAAALGVEDTAFAAKISARGEQQTVRYPIDSDDLRALELITD